MNRYLEGMIMTLLRPFLTVLILALSLAAPGRAQDAVPPVPEGSPNGGAQTLESILARQQGLNGSDPAAVDPAGALQNAAPVTAPLGTLGGASDPALWRALRAGSADVIASAHTPGAELLMQEGGMEWLAFRAGPLRTWGGYALLGMVALLALFYLIRGRIRIEAGRSGILIERFKFIERFGHWLIAGSFIVMGITGLISLFGRVGLIPYIGHSNYAVIAAGAKLIHDNVSWAFMLGLILVFLMWVRHNIPNRYDLVWVLKAGGLFSKHSHPHSKKFNAGQKIVFWAVILLGGSISLSGLSLLFPHDLPLFAKTFQIINDLGIPGWFGAAPLPTTLAPQEEMQLAQMWHAIVAFAFMVVILAHIYIGTLGMEGAFDAMGSGEVDLNWAREHHDLWVEEVQAKSAASPVQRAPAE